MGFSRLNIKGEIQSSKYDHRIFWLLSSGQRKQQKETTELLIKTTLPHLSLDSSLSAHDDTQDKNHFWPT